MNFHQGSSLYEHASANNLLAVRYMLNNGANVNIRDNESGSTPLMTASWSNFYRVVRELLNHDGVNVNAQDGTGDTALMGASLQGH